ncbi:hypothetical protein ACVIYH_009098 [Bradyrhizobium diazoefficiens]
MSAETLKLIASLIVAGKAKVIRNKAGELEVVSPL